MVHVDLQNPLGLHAHLRLDGVEVPLHLEAHALAGGHAHRMGLQLPGDTDLVHALPEGLLHEVQGFLIVVRLLLLRHIVQIQIAVHGGAEGLLLVLPEDLHQHLIRLIGEVQYLHIPLPQKLGLGQIVHDGGVLAGGVVDVLLTFRHPVHIFSQGHQLLLRGGVEQQQILKQLLPGPVVVDAPNLQLAAKVPEELLIALPVILQHPLQLALDLLLDVVGDKPQLAVMLEQLPGDVQAQVRGIHHALDEAEVVPDQVLTLIHNHDPGRIQLESPLIVGAVIVIGRPGGNVQQGLVGHLTLGGNGNHRLRSGVIVEFLLIELVVLLPGHVALLPLPQGDHAVECLLLPVALVLGLILGGILLLPGLGDLHADGPADVVGVLPHQVPEGVLLEELAVLLLLAILLYVHNDVGACSVLLAGGDGVAIGPVALPAVSLGLAVLLGNHGNAVGHHEGGVEAHAKLPDDVHILVVLAHLLAELVGAAGGNDAQVILQLLLAHADTVVADGEQPGLGVGVDGDAEVLPLEPHVFVRQGPVAQLVDGIAGVGDNFPQKDLLVGVDGVDHQV